MGLFDFLKKDKLTAEQIAAEYKNLQAAMDDESKVMARLEEEIRALSRAELNGETVNEKRLPELSADVIRIKARVVVLNESMVETKAQLVEAIRREEREKQGALQNEMDILKAEIATGLKNVAGLYAAAIHEHQRYVYAPTAAPENISDDGIFAFRDAKKKLEAGTPYNYHDCMAQKVNKILSEVNEMKKNPIDADQVAVGMLAG